MNNPCSRGGGTLVYNSHWEAVDDDVFETAPESVDDEVHDADGEVYVRGKAAATVVWHDGQIKAAKDAI